MSLKKERILNIDDVLSSRNINGEIYFSDVSLWLGDSVGLEEKRSIWQKLNEVKDKVNA